MVARHLVYLSFMLCLLRVIINLPFRVNNHLRGGARVSQIIWAAIVEVVNLIGI